MADNADGSVIIDTELDNTGFQKDSAKLLSAIKDLTNAVDNMGDNMMNSFQAVLPLLQSIGDSAAQTYSAINAASQQTAATNEQVVTSEQQVTAIVEQTAEAVQSQGAAIASMNESVVESTVQATEAVREQEQAVSDAGAGIREAENNTKIGLSEVENAAQTTTQAVQQAAEQAQSFGSGLNETFSSGAFDKQLSAAGRSCETLSTQLQRIGDSARIGLNTDAQITRFQIQIEKARESIAQMRQTLISLETQRVSTADYDELAAATARAEQALFRLYDRRDIMTEMGVRENSREWQRLAIQITNAEAVLNRYEQSMRAMESTGTAYTIGGNSTQYQQMAASLKDMTARLAEYERMAANFDTVSAPAAKSQSSLEGVDRELRQKPKDASFASSAIRGFGSALKSAAAAALKLIKTLAKTSFKALVNGAKAAARGISSFIKKSKDATLSSKGLVKSLTSLKTMLLSRLKRTFISAIVSNVKEALQSFAQYSSAFDASMSSMKNSVRGLSGNIAVAFGSIVNAVAPAISTIVNWLSQAISYLNAFFAMLSGKSVVTVAKKQTDSYAKSLGGAAGAAKELKNQVYGFDELNKEQSQSDGGGSGGGSGSGGGDLFEDVPIDSLLPDSVAAFFDKLKAAFEAENWSGIGRIIAGGLNTVVSTVDDWINNTFRPEAVKWSERIALGLNGLVDRFDTYTLGETLADGINAIFDTINTFLTTFDFGKLGYKIGAGINGWFNKIEWDLIGQTFANKWNALIDGLGGVIQAVDWVGIGSDIATFVGNWFSTIKWNEAGKTVSDGIKGILTSINTFLAETNWQEIGNNIATFIANIDWSGIWESITTGIKGAMTGLGAIVAGLISQALIGIGQYFDESIEEAGGSVVLGILNGIGKAIIGIGQWIYDNVFSPFIEGFKSVFGIQSPSTVMEEQGGYIVDGLFNGIIKFFADIGQWIYDHIFKPFIDAFKSWFGIGESSSSEMEGLGGNLIEGLWKGFEDAWNDFWAWIQKPFGDFVGFVGGVWENVQSGASKWWDDITGTLSGAWDGISGTAQNMWNGLTGTVAGAWEDVKSDASTAWGNITSTLSGAWDGASRTADSMWKSITGTIGSWFGKTETNVDDTSSEITDKLSSAWDTVKSDASSIWTNVKTTVGNLFTGLKTSLVSTGEGIKGSLSMAWDGVKTTATEKWNSVSSWISSTFSGLKTSLSGIDWTGIGSNVLGGLKSGISNGWNSVKSWVTDKFSSLVSGVKKVFGISSPSKVFASIGEFLMSGMQIGLEDGESAVIRTVSGIAKSITDSFNGESPEMTVSENAMLNGISTIADKLSGIASIFTTIAETLVAIGGFHAPAIAAGTAVPYKTRVDTSEALAGGQGALSDFTRNFDETMSDQSDLLREIRDIIQRLNLTVDGDSIMRALNYLQRAQARNFGGA